MLLRSSQTPLWVTLAPSEARELARTTLQPIVRVGRPKRSEMQVGVAAIDFTPPSISAARVLHGMLAPRSTLFLVQVVERNDPDSFEAHLDRHHEAVLRDAFESLKQQLRSERSDIRIVEVWRSGDVTEQVVEFAHSNGADAVATGCGSVRNNSKHGRSTAIAAALGADWVVVPAESAMNAELSWDDRWRLELATSPRVHESPYPSATIR